MKEMSRIDVLKGVGEKTSKLLNKMGIFTIEDLLLYYPRNYDVYERPVTISALQEDTTAAVMGSFKRAITIRRIKRMQIAAGEFLDATGSLSVTWYNMPYLKNTLDQDRTYILRGRIIRKKQQLFMEQPAVFDIADYEKLGGKMQPIYSVKEGLSSRQLTKLVLQTLEFLDLSKEYLPDEIRRKWNLSEYNFAIRQIHFPKDMHHLMLARERLVFDEFFLFILALRSLREQKEKVSPFYRLSPKELPAQLINQLPYQLTRAQQKVWSEIEADMTGESAMARLIQGDVGSGKTIIAILALILTVENGFQGTMMVPTEVLAVQHYDSICELLSMWQLPYQVVLLTGSMTTGEKRKTNDKIKSGKADIIIGTHALFQETVTYKNLALVITDEQHRFGVKQREALSQKGNTPHILVMSATPIPRTLAVIIYGDLDISVIDEMPANRIPIKNCVVNTGYRNTAYSFIQKEVEAGRQAYIICPMVEESEVIEAENVIDYSKRVQAVFSDHITVEYLHGKMKAKEKNHIMQKFLENKVQVLISTTVVEVGVNVPNATIMLIENAERFGLAQLHQLRGRVGRGKYQSYCIMIYGKNSKKTKERLEILNKSNDGFYIASEDLKLRGPGDFFGIRQSGFLEFKLGDVFGDARILKDASEAVTYLLKTSENLQHDNCQVLKSRLEQYMHFQFNSLNL